MMYDRETWDEMVQSTISPAVIDARSGIALDVPFGMQGSPGWWQDDVELYNRLVARRAELGIVVQDDYLEENGRLTGLPPATYSGGKSRRPRKRARR